MVPHAHVASTTENIFIASTFTAGSETGSYMFHVRFKG
jgi:hypothetical protein